MSNSGSTVSEVDIPKPSGLEGVVAASTALSHVFGEEGKLVYRGYDIHELAGKASFEEVAYLLWVGHLPNETELEEFSAKLGANRELPPETIAILKQLPADAAPMDALRTGISSLGSLLPGVFHEEPDLDQAVALAARFPSVLAAFHRLRTGQDPITPKPAHNTAQTYLYQLFGKEPEERHWKPLETYLTLLA
ncbi:MAG: citrate/2-methylcitrate synthase, partial [Thermomicrobiales bacterium]